MRLLLVLTALTVGADGGEPFTWREVQLHSCMPSMVCGHRQKVYPDGGTGDTEQHCWTNYPCK